MDPNTNMIISSSPDDYAPPQPKSRNKSLVILVSIILVVVGFLAFLLLSGRFLDFRITNKSEQVMPSYYEYANMIFSGEESEDIVDSYYSPSKIYMPEKILYTSDSEIESYYAKAMAKLEKFMEKYAESQGTQNFGYSYMVLHKSTLEEAKKASLEYKNDSSDEDYEKYQQVRLIAKECYMLRQYAEAGASQEEQK